MCMARQDGCCCFGSISRLLTVAKSINRGHQRPAGERLHHVEVTGSCLSWECSGGNTPFDQGPTLAEGLCNHFFIVTVVPLPGLESTSNSSMSLRAPGRPSPRLLLVE